MELSSAPDVAVRRPFESFASDVGGPVKSRILAGLFASGATLALLTVLLPHAKGASELGLVTTIVIAYLVAGLLYLRAAKLRPRALQLALAWGTVLVTSVAYFSGQDLSPLVFFYLWVFLYSAYFFTVAEMTLQIVFVGVLYLALLLAGHPPGGAPAWWLVGVGTLTVAALLVRQMRERLQALIASLYEAARTDPLTELTNRRGFRERLDLELERARRGETRLAVLLGDLDHFKEVNDRCGHQVGDVALRRAGQVLEMGKRAIDGLARVGGEEFALVLPDTDAHEAFVLAERVRCLVGEEFAADSVSLTISFGVATFPEHGGTASALLQTADEALYAAKRGGRNMTVIHSEALRELKEQPAEERDIAAERFLAVVLDLAEAVDLRFSGSARHSETVGRYAELIAGELGLSEGHAARVRLAGMLHDIGKVGVPDEILNKPGSLTGAELAVIRTHPALGAQILEHSSLADVRAWVAAHHERPDGEGYPRGLSGEEIPIEAQIVAVADAYEAMTSNRSYRAALKHTEARRELARSAGTQFDKTVVGAFMTLLEKESRRAEEAIAAV
ncbi:MAG TPA: diguanylate cyclase [Solirubrobacteraceae bacterium]|jgi:diguanylate cyclase (GGDEF)-like protein/putative nucleotidyltransferase with HDIG domain|nr:diguanylate cyclase [Solirubrobacteraceae bacterium]